MARLGILEVHKIINADNPGIFKLGGSIQSTTRSVIEKIKRINIPLSDLKEIHENTDNISNFTELIIPLPEETKESFYNVLKDVIDYAQFNNIAIHHLILLNGSEMATREEREIIGFETRFRVFIECLGEYLIGEEKVPIVEIEETVVGTKTISYDDYIEMRKMTLTIKIFIDGSPFREIFGLLQFFCISAVDTLLEIQNNSMRGSPLLMALFEDYLELA